MRSSFTERYWEEDKIQNSSMSMKKKIGIFALALFLTVGIITTGCSKNSDDIQPSTDIEAEMEIQAEPDEVASDTGSDFIDESGMVSISDSTLDSNAPAVVKENMVDIAITGSGRADPFLPFAESGRYTSGSNLPYVVLPPLENSDKDTNARKILTTKVSGIMYDETSPSAILNIEGTDYLVRSGDILNNYKVLSISKSVVVVQLGSNVYRAGVGQILTEGEVNYNEIANLEHKFGGARK